MCYDRAGIWSLKGQICRSTYTDSPLGLGLRLVINVLLEHVGLILVLPLAVHLCFVLSRYLVSGAGGSNL